MYYVFIITFVDICLNKPTEAIVHFSLIQWGDDVECILALKVIFVLTDYLRIVTLRLNGLPVQPGAMYIHEYGDLSKGCGSTGGHCNLLSVNHPQHPGDFGNFIPVNENIHQSLDSSATLFGRLLKKMDDQVVQAGVDEDQGKR
uniref:Superoxide dismutase copper/zinc binding domain-containing protein n=1 Tax=Cyprinus carpio TaxID=7962 RepID=A0A8C2A185_CYPCA